MRSRIKDKLIELKTSLIFSLINALKSPLSWSSVFWDGYNRNEFPDNLMRLLRISMGIATILRFVTPAFLGLFLMVDGLYAIYRYRVELPKTKNWYEDLPRGARSLLGCLLLTGFI